MDRKDQKDPSSHLEKLHFEETKIPLGHVLRSLEEETLWEYPVTQEQPVRVLTQAYTCSLSQFPIFHSLPPTTRRKPRICSINEKTSATLSLKDIVLESL